MKNKFTRIIIVTLILSVASCIYSYAQNNSMSPELCVR